MLHLFFLKNDKKCNIINNVYGFCEGEHKMTDNYVELLVKKKTSAMVKALRFSCILMGVFQLFIGALFHAWFFMGTGVIFIVFSWVVAYFGNIEYEYLYVDRQFSVDKIHNRRKRKKIAEYNLETELEVLAPKDSHQLDYMKERVSQTRNYTSGSEDAQVYEMVVHVGDELWLIKIEMTDELFEQLRMVAPRKVFKD